MTSDQWTAIIGIGTIIVVVGTLILIVIGIVSFFRRALRPDLRYQVVSIDFLVSPQEAAELGTDLELLIDGTPVQIAPAIRSYVLRITNFGARIDRYDDPIVIDFGTQATKIWTVTKPETFPGTFTVPKPILHPTSVEIGGVPLNSNDGIRVRCLVQSDDRLKPVIRARGDGFSLVKELSTSQPFRLRTMFRDALILTMLSAVAVLVFPPHPRGELWVYIVFLALLFAMFVLSSMLGAAGQYVIFPPISSRWQTFLDRRRRKVAAEAANKATGARPKP